MSVFPFYLEANSSTRSTNATCSVRRKEGCMQTDIYQRNKGAIERPFSIMQYSESEDGKLYLYTRIQDNTTGEILKEYRTEY